MDILIKLAKKYKLSVKINIFGPNVTIYIPSKKLTKNKKITLSIDENFSKNLQDRLDEKEKQLSAPKKKKHNTIETISSIDRKLRPIFSKAIRYNGAFWKNGERHNYCFTTKKILPVSKLQAGHWISRKYKALKYHPDNVRPQSYAANAKHIGNGMPQEFEYYLKREGVDTEKLQANKNNQERIDVYYSREYLLSLMEKCKEFIKQYEN